MGNDGREERQKELLRRLREHEAWPSWPRVFDAAADEIERLADRVASLEACADLNLQEAERLARERDIWVRDGEIAWRKALEKFNPIQTR